MRALYMLLLLIAVSVTADAQVKKKVAVYVTGEDVEEMYKKVIGSRLVSAITQTDEYAAVERTADFLDAIAKENDYQLEEVRDSQIAAIGQKFGVRYVVVADVTEVFEELFISARLLNVETGLVENACDASGYAESVSQLINISNKIAEGLVGRRTASSVSPASGSTLTGTIEVKRKRTVTTTVVM